MTRELHVPAQPRLRVTGQVGTETVVEFVLAHGADPVRALRELGWVATGVAGLTSRVEPDHELILVYDVRPAEPAEPEPAAPPVPTDDGLVLEADEAPRPHQRTAAYAVVSADRGILLTQLSDATNAAGQWNLPGGGIDRGETPEDALHREVWEETGQRIAEVRLLEVHTAHWIGRAPSGRAEDFHAVRIIFAATCPEPSTPVIHDVGGSTSDARWVLPEDLAGYDLTRSVGPHLARWLSDGDRA